MQNTEASPRLLAPAEAADRTSMSWRTIQRKVRANLFPQPVRISENRIAFFEHEIAAWIAGRPRVSEAA